MRMVAIEHITPQTIVLLYSFGRDYLIRPYCYSETVVEDRTLILINKHGSSEVTPPHRRYACTRYACTRYACTRYACTRYACTRYACVR